MKKIQINVKEDAYKEYQELCREKGTSVAVEFRMFMMREVEKARSAKYSAVIKAKGKLVAVRENMAEWQIFAVGSIVRNNHNNTYGMVIGNEKALFTDGNFRTLVDWETSGDELKDNFEMLRNTEEWHINQFRDEKADERSLKYADKLEHYADVGANADNAEIVKTLKQFALEIDHFEEWGSETEEEEMR